MPERRCPRCSRVLPAGARTCPYCATARSPAGPGTPQRRLPKGHRLGSYRIERFIASGGMGHVYEAFRVPSGKRVALKVLETLKSVDDESYQRFLREVQTLAWLRHPNIVQPIEAGQEDRWVFLAMEYVVGGNLEECVRKRGPLAVKDSMSVVGSVAAALDHAWRNRIVHRDVKPTNILLTRSGRAKLADLGLGKLIDLHPSLTSTGAMLGSPAYMAPEQTMDSKSVDVRADVYSLGMVWFFCLAGRPPFTGRGVPELVAKVRSAPLPSLRSIAPNVPPWIEQCIEKMGAKDPERRFADPGEVLRCLARQSL